MINKKSSFTLIETVVVISILSIIIVSSSIYILNIKNLYKKTNQNQTDNLSLINAKYILENYLKNSINFKISEHKIIFDKKIDEYSQFENNVWQSYSHYCDLNLSNQNQIISKNSRFDLISNNNIYANFDNKEIFKVIVIDENRLQFENNSSKTFSQFFDLIEINQTLEYKNNSIFLNENLLINNILKFNIDVNNSKIVIEFCQDKCIKTII
jgi:type II secretory pathway pseudopilin PulG